MQSGFNIRSIQQIIDDATLPKNEVLATLAAYKKQANKDYVALITAAIKKQNYRVIQLILPQLAAIDYAKFEMLLAFSIENFDDTQKNKENLFDILKPC